MAKRFENDLQPKRPSSCLTHACPYPNSRSNAANRNSVHYIIRARRWSSTSSQACCLHHRPCRQPSSFCYLPWKQCYQEWDGCFLSKPAGELLMRQVLVRVKGCWWPMLGDPSLVPRWCVSGLVENESVTWYWAYSDPRHGASWKDAVFVANSDSGLAIVDGLLVSSYHDTLDPAVKSAHYVASTVGFLEIATLHLVDVVLERL